MLLDEKEIRTRMESPMNLLNRLRSITNPHKNTNIIPALPPTAEDIIKDLDDKLSGDNTKDKASKLLNSTLDELKKRLPEVQKPEKLAAIAEQMSKVVDRVTPAKNPGDEGDLRRPQIIIYAPIVAREEAFNIIDVGDS